MADRLEMPPIDACGVQVTITGIAEEADEKPAFLLCLPREAASEVSELFLRMVKDAKTSYKDSPSRLLYASPGSDPQQVR